MEYLPMNQHSSGHIRLQKGNSCRAVAVNAVVKDETVWLTQKAMAELFGCSSDNISLHLKNIFATGELDKNSVTEKISATAADGKKYLTQFYNLDAIISVGYCVNSHRATNFRIWQQITDIFAECSIDYDRTASVPMSSMPWCKTSFILPLLVRRLLKF